MPRGRPAKADREALLADYQNLDLTLRDIAEKHGVSTATVSVWAHDAGLSRPHGGGRAATADRSEVMKDWANLELTVSAICKKHRVARETLLRWAHDDGVLDTRKHKSRRITRDESPAILHDDAGAWVYDSNGLAHWTPGAKAQPQDGAT